ncbi:MAG: protein-disulfide reductase DsbD [Methylococcales bacterium]|nr:protein-disulfide reductase DsbD [Methylococcales bacterium]
MSFIATLFLSFFILVTHQAQALGTSGLLTADKAFSISAKAISAEKIEVSWAIADGYYLYQSKTKIISQTEEVQIGKLNMPAGKPKHDDFFGDMVIYTNQLNVSAPITNKSALSSVKLLIKYQGCSESGICYPPQQKTLTLNIPQPKTSTSSDSINQLLNGFSHLKNNIFQDELLPGDQAFQLFASIKDANTLHVNWVIADGYYLYKEKTKLSLLNSASTQLGTITLPQGTPYHDESFGQVHIFHNELSFDVPLNRTDKRSHSISLLVKYQGCADRGVCYPPMEKTIELLLPETLTLNKPSTAPKEKLSEQDQIFQSLQHDSFGLTLLSFFGFGLLLAFTPCIFPMIPILSGIIVGQGENVTTRKAFLLSLSYVIASALTYTVFGILAALFGSNLQIIFQEPWVIAVFSGIFILLSFSMFGFYNLELPKTFQAKLHNSSDSHRDGSYIGAAIMGALSSLIVGPCVAAPLAGALVYIGQTGDVILGGSALFMMGFAMGTPLLLLGASAGSLLPKAGHWLNSTKAVFGVIMLAVSVWMLDRILPASITMLLTASLLIIPAIYLRAIDPLPENISGWPKLWKGFGLMLLVYGVLLLIGLSMGNTNPLQPLQGIGSINTSSEQKHGLTFKRVASLAELDEVLEKASKDNQWVMLDFYADWCISCKEMEAYTFTDEKVKQKLSDFVLIQADVTKNSADDKALLERFNLIGPPAIIFFGSDKQERKASRVIGYQNSDTFLSNLNSL